MERERDLSSREIEEMKRMRDTRIGHKMKGCSVAQELWPEIIPGWIVYLFYIRYHQLD